MDNLIATTHHYTLKRQILAGTGKVRVYTPGDLLVLYAEQKLLKLKEDIRLFFQGFEFNSLLHEELRLASPKSRGDDGVWLRIPKAFFWRLTARKR